MAEGGGGGSIIGAAGGQGDHDCVQQAQNGALHRQGAAVCGLGAHQQRRRHKISHQLAVPASQRGALQKLRDEGDHHHGAGIAAQRLPCHKFVHFHAPFSSSRMRWQAAA
nr:MAG TPA: hypothetical protein [Caudoviricetes sp.]